MYQVLARKYRPRNFAELVGQMHVSRALGSALERGRLHHAYLFTGTRGVGKTTIARILSKCLNCETGITSTPCGICSTCRAIDEGRFIDLIEIDAASRTKVEDTRELLDNVPYAPTQGRYKVYLIDEVHMLSTHSFNALLKTLEEPPEHVKFLLATTDPQKLPVTVLSRCLQFTLRPLPRQEIHDHLSKVLQQEHIVNDDASLWMLAEAAQGSLRDAMSLTDQAIAYGQGEVKATDVQAMLGLLDRNQVAYLLQAIHRGDGAQVSQILFDLSQQAIDVTAVLDQLVTLLHYVALTQLLPSYVDHSPMDRGILQQLASQIGRQDVQLYYQIAMQGRADLKLAVTTQQGFEMCVLRLLAFRPLAVNETVGLENADIGSSHHAIEAVVSPAVTRSVDAATQSELKKNNDALISDHRIIAHTETSAISNQPEREIAEPHTVRVDMTQEVIVSEIVDSSPASMDEVESEVDTYAAEADTEEADTEADWTQDDADEISEAHEDLQLEAEEASDVGGSSDQDHVVTPPVPDFVLKEAPPSKTVQATIASYDVTPVVQSSEVLNVKQEQPNTSTQSSKADQDKDPFELLAYPIVALEGEWNAEKWEFWLRSQTLSGGVLSLGQHGLLQGVIGGAVELIIPYEHRILASQMQEGLLMALQQDWPETQLTITHAEPADITPVLRKEQRIKQAQARAEELIVSDPRIAPLLQQLDGEILEMALKAGLTG